MRKAKKHMLIDNTIITERRLSIEYQVKKKLKILHQSTESFVDPTVALSH